MATRIICCFGGELERENKQWTYNGGSTKTMSLDVDTTYEELLSRMYGVIKSTPIDCDIRMKVLYPCSNKSIPPTVLEDDGDVKEFLATQLEHSKKFIPLVIEPIQHINMAIHVDSVAEEQCIEFDNKENPLQVGGTNDQLPKPPQAPKFVSTQVKDGCDLDIGCDYMARPLATIAALPSSSSARRYINFESDAPHPHLPETSNFNTRQVPVPFDDAAFTNDQLPQPPQAPKFVSTQVKDGCDLDLGCDYMAPPLTTRAALSSSSRARRYLNFESDTPHPDLPKTSNFNTRQVPVPFDDAAFTNDQLPEPPQAPKFVSTQVKDGCDLDLGCDYMAPPLATREALPSSSRARRYINPESDTPHPDLPQTSNFNTRQVPVPFDDAAFTNAAMLEYTEYTDSLSESINIVEGQTFRDKSQCQHVLSLFALQNKFQYRVLYSNSKRYTVVCFEDTCEWRVHASRERGTGIFKIRTYTSNHTCGMSWMRSDHRQASSKLACDLVVSRIEQRLELRPKDIVFAMQEKYNIVISYRKAWAARERAINQVMGSYEDSYNQLPLYLHELRTVNPGTVTALRVNEETFRFERCFVALGQCVRSFQKSMRRVLAIDGTHLKGKYKGVLFIATALDGDNHIFPVAFGIGESENGSSWNWFLTYLSDAIGSMDDLVIISDRHKGLLKEVPQVFPRAIHGYCAYHIYRNLVDTFKDKSLEMYFWRAVKTCRVAEFEKVMNDIEMANPAVHAWLTEIGYERWASSHFPGKRFNLVTTNISECVNALFKEAREYPITKLIEAVRLKIQELFYKRKESAASFIGPLTPWADQQLKDLVQKAREVRCHPISRDEYYVVGDYNDTVKLSEFSCTCRELGVKGYPCMHVLSACINYNLPHYSYCSPFYTVQTYIATYSESVYPLRDEGEWGEISVGFKEYCAQIKPPGQRRSAGRPKKLRIQSRGEESKTTKCGRCKQTGHNRRKCKFPIPEK